MDAALAHAVDATPSIGALIDDLHSNREKIRKLEKQVSELKEVRDDLELRLIEAMDAQGIMQSRGAHATATITESVKPSVEDWDLVNAYIKRNNAFYLYERRIASAAFRELLERRNGKPIPGIVPFTKRSIGLRSR